MRRNTITERSLCDPSRTGRDVSGAAIKGPIFVVAAVIRNSLGQVLLARRPTSHPIAGGLWEFPGGKVEPGEKPEDALIREIQEELGVTIVVARSRGQDGLLGLASHVYPGAGDSPNVHILLAGYHADLAAGDEAKIRLSDVAEVKWIFAHELPDSAEFAPADIPFLPLIFS